MQDKGLAAMERLDKSLDEFQALLEEKDKQEVPIKQQEALGFVGAVEEAMVKGFPYEVPKQYSALPQLKARPCGLPPPGCRCRVYGQACSVGTTDRGSPYDVPKQYASLPEPKARLLCCLTQSGE